MYAHKGAAVRHMMSFAPLPWDGVAARRFAAPTARSAV
jgi:hypothetical protein